MREIILQNKKNGRPVLISILVLYCAAIAGFIWS